MVLCENMEDKLLLLQDLCARFPYGVKVHKKNSELDGTLIDTELRNGLLVITTPKISVCTISIDECKPYLRPMSSMTEEEKKERGHYIYDLIGDNLLTYEVGFDIEDIIFEYIDWLNRHHFDYRGLIEKGLALEAPEGMY